MKSKRLALVVLTAGLSVLSCIPAFASGWQKDTVGWWYGTNENNTTWYNSGWQWVDGNNDGIAESYYFNSNGYIAVNTTVDGYTVNNDGAWTVNGIVQTKQVGLTDTSTNTSEDKTGGQEKWTGGEKAIYDAIDEYNRKQVEEWSSKVDWSQFDGGGFGDGPDIHF